MSLNKVKERCKREEFAKFYYASQKMFFDLKASRVLLYIIALVPVVLAVIPNVDTMYVTVCSLISFGLSLLNEALTSFFNEYKKKAVMEYQLHECGITGTEFAKIEYDRETTNEVNELAIRKGLPKMRKLESFYDVNVSDDISDDYTYLYLCRRSAATTKYLLSRIFYIYLVFLILVAVGFVTAAVFKNGDSAAEYLVLIITFYPLISPIIKACGKCKECMKDCTKMCADIDNFFADGDISIGRLARMHYYVQNLEFEMMTNRPTIYNGYKKLFKKGVEDLEEGVTIRFKRAIVELKSKSMMQKGIISAPNAKTLITKGDDYDLAKLNKLEKDKKHKSKATKTETAPKVTNTTGDESSTKAATPAKEAKKNSDVVTKAEPKKTATVKADGKKTETKKTESKKSETKNIDSKKQETKQTNNKKQKSSQ